MIITTLKFFYVMGKALSGELSCPCVRSCLHCKNIRRIYGRIAGNLLPGHAPFFLRKNISHGRIGKRKVVLLTAA